MNMANLMNIFTENFSSMNTLLKIKNDAAEIKNSLMIAYKNTSVRALDIKRNNKYIRSIFSWFNQHDDENDVHSSLLHENDDDFDAGFHYADDDSQESSSIIMDAESMQSISNEVTREMFKIGRKKAESNLQTLSEILTTLDDRSSEIIASLRTVDTSARIIADKLELIIRGMETGITRRNKKDFSYKGFLQNSNGRLTLSSVFDFAKKNEEHVTKTFVKTLMDMSGLSEMDKQLNETIQSYQHSFLEKLFDLPLIQKYYRPDRVSTDYELQITSRYDRTQAIFDGMTRKSIISIIPDYLREITDAITGIRLNISDRGSLTTNAIEDKFVKSIDVTFDISTFNDRRLDELIEESTAQNDQIDSADLREVLKLMVEQYVGQAYLYSNRNHFRSSQLENGGDKGLHRHIAALLKKAKGKSLGYWMSLIEIYSSKFITDKHYRIDFASAINKALNDLDDAARKNIKNSRKVTNTQFTQEMFDERALTRLKYNSSKFEHEGKTLRQLIQEKVISIDSLSETELANLDKPITTFADLNDRIETSSTEVTSNFLNDLQTKKLELAKQIFDLLNSGINVYMVDSMFPKMKSRKTKQKKTKEKKSKKAVNQNNPHQTTTNSSQTSNDEQTPVEEQVSDVDESPTYAPTLEPINETPQSNNSPAQDDDDTNEKVSEISSILSASGGNPAIVNFVSSQISSIKDIGIQQTLKTIVTGSIDRSGKKDEKKSSLGKGIFFVLGLAKSFFSKIFSGIKSFLTLKRKILMKLLAPSLEKMKTGARALKEGLFGSDDSVGVIKGVKNKISERRDQNRIHEIESTLEPIDESPKKQKTKQQKQTTPKPEEEKKSNSIQEQFANTKIGKGIKSFNNKITDKLKSSDFGRGLLSAFDKSESKIVGTSLFDTSSDGIQDMLTRPSNLTEGVILSIMQSFDYINEQADLFMDKLNDKTESEIEDKQNKKKEDEEKKQKEEQEKQSKAKKKPSGIAFAAGKMLGGLMGILSGLTQAIMTVVVSMAGFKKITSLIHKTLTSILKPLNKAFNSIYKAIKPVMKTIQNVLKQLVEYVVQIVESVITIIQPLLEMIGPLLEQIMSVLAPILEMITGLINVLVVPLTAVMQTVVVPLMQGIANSIEIIFGIVQVGLGSILIVTGALMIGVGAIGKIFGAGSLFDAGSNVMSLGTNMVKSGASGVISGMQKQVSLIGSLVTGEINRTQEEPKQETNNEQRRRENTVDTLNGSPMDGIYGSGDANAPYKFDDNVLDALETLRSLSSGIISLFTGETDTDTKLESAKDREAYAKAQMDTADLPDEKRKEIDDRAFEMFKQTINNEKLAGETDEQYRARYEANKEKYWAKAATEILREKVKSVADGSDEGAVAMTNSALGLNEDDKFAKMLMDYDNSVEQGSAVSAMGDFVNSMAYSDEGGYYEDDEYYYEGGGTGDIFQAAAEVFTVARKTAGGDLRWNGTSVTNLRFSDGMVIDKISPTHCTSMMTAVVKRMGYYVPGNQASYSDTYQGTDQLIATAGGHGALSWGLQSSDGHPNIYDRDGKVSEDWITGVGNPQPGDITFGGIGANIHAHMGVYTGADGNWFGFNGGADDSLASSVKLGEYYLKHGTVPTDTRLNVVPGKWCNDHAWTDQVGAVAPPMTYWVRYVGPKSKGKRRRVKRSGGGANTSSRGGLGIGGSKEDWIKTVAMMFEGYYYNGDKYYDNHNVHTFKIRDGRTVKARPDCSGMLGAAMTAFGYKIDGAPSGSHFDVTGSNGNLNFIHDPDGSVSKDWKLIKFTGNNLEPGDITGNTAHASFPITDLTSPFPSGFDAGGNGNIEVSAKAARALLDGKSDIQWHSAMGSGAYTSVGGAKNIVRYVGGGGSSKSSSSSSSSRRIVSSKSSSSRSTPRITSSRVASSKVKTKSGKSGKEALIESASEIFEAYQKTNPALTYSNGLWPKSIRTRSGHTRQIRPDCSGTMSAAIQELGYTLRDLNGNDVGDIGLRSGTWGSQTKNTLIFDSPTAKTPSKDWTVLEYSKSKLQRGDILAFPPPPGQASGHLTMPITDLTTTPRGLDGGGGIQRSPAAAVAYLSGKKDSDIPWVQNGGMSVMKKIWRYKGTTSVASANSTARAKQNAKTKSTAARTKQAQLGTVSSKANNKVLRAASETFLAALAAQKRDNGPYGHGAILRNVTFDDGMVIDNMSAMCTGTQAAIVKRMGYYLPKQNGKSYSKTYQGDPYMGWANGTPSGWGVNNSDGHPNIYDKNGKKSKDWIVTNDGSYQAGDITLPGTAWGDKSQTMWHAHMAAFKYGGNWYGFNGGDPTNNSESIKGQNIARYYLKHGKMPSDGSGIDISQYNSSGYLQNYGGKTGVVIRYVGPSTTSSATKKTVAKKNTKTSAKKKTTTKKKTTSSKSTALKGSTPEAQIFNYLTQNTGMSKKGAAGMMGCMKYESGMKSNNLEDSYNAKFGMTDAQYTSAVDNKKESKQQFVYGRYATYLSGQTPGEAVGYGLTQFTSSDLKRRLYEKTVEKGKSIADIGSQMDATVDTLKSRKVGSNTLFQTIKNAKTPTEANKWFLWRYEAGTGYNSDEAVASAYPWMGMSGINNRHKAAEEYYRTYGSGDEEVYDTSAFDIPYDEQPMIDFVSDPSMFDGDDSDYISADPFEDIPYNPNPGPMIIPELPQTPINEQPQMPTIINKYKFVNGLENLTQYIDEFLVNEYDIQSVEIRSLVDQIYEEFPEYIEDYFDDDDDEFTIEDDLLIQDMASVFL